MKERTTRVMPSKLEKIQVLFPSKFSGFFFRVWPPSVEQYVIKVFLSIHPTNTSTCNTTSAHARQAALKESRADIEVTSLGHFSEVELLKCSLIKGLSIQFSALDYPTRGVAIYLYVVEINGCQKLNVLKSEFVAISQTMYVIFFPPLSYRTQGVVKLSYSKSSVIEVRSNMLFSGVKWSPSRTRHSTKRVYLLNQRISCCTWPESCRVQGLFW